MLCFLMFKLFIWSFHVYVLDKLLRTDQYHWYLPHTAWTSALSNISGTGSTFYVTL